MENDNIIQKMCNDIEIEQIQQQLAETSVPEDLKDQNLTTVRYDWLTIDPAQAEPPQTTYSFDTIEKAVVSDDQYEGRISSAEGLAMMIGECAASNKIIERIEMSGTTWGKCLAWDKGCMTAAIKATTMVELNTCGRHFLGWAFGGYAVYLNNKLGYNQVIITMA